MNINIGVCMRCPWPPTIDNILEPSRPSFFSLQKKLGRPGFEATVSLFAVVFYAYLLVLVGA